MVLLGVLALCALALGGGASAQERAPANVWTVTTADDPGPDVCAEVCSLRAAINAANESDGGGEIRFAIVGAATITPTVQLPPLRDAEITLDGRTQPGWSAAAPPPVYLDGRRAGDAAGIVIYGPNAAVRGLAIGGFQRYGIGIIGAGARGATVQDNWLGMTPDGRGAAANRLSGVAVLAGASDARVAGNRIAGNSTGNSAEGRTGHGVVVGGAGARGAQVTENIIGLNADGLPLPNDDGVLVVDGAQAVVRGNVICASRVAGVEFRDTRAGGAVDGNRIGVAGDGRAAANDVGVFLGGGVAEVSVGARGRNIIAANRVGIAVEQGARAVLLQDNWIGLVPAPDSDALADALPAPNAERGISIIAGASQVRVVANQVLAGERGIVIAGQGTAQVSLHRNTIGGAVGATSPTVAGIEAREASDLRIGGDRGLGNAVQGAASAILLADIAEVDVSYNRIGAEFAQLGFASDSETGVGIALTAGARSARIGENRIGGVAGAAVELSGAGTRDNLITRNVFGNIGGEVGGEAIALGAAVSAPAPPTLQSYAVERRSPNRLRSTIRGQGEPGTAVEVYELGADRIGYVARAEVDEDGTFEATSLLAPQGEIRAVAISRRGTGQTSQFSASMSTPDRQTIGDPDKLQWIAIEGVERPVGEALAVLEPSLEAAWRWDAGAGRWLAWSPRVPAALNTLTTVRGGDVLALRLLEGAPREYFSTESAGGPPASALLRAGQNLVSWNGPWVEAIAALERLDAEQPGLLSVVEQWDGERWRVIWPRLGGAWDPGEWGAPALRVRATSDALWVQSG